MELNKNYSEDEKRLLYKLEQRALQSTRGWVNVSFNVHIQLINDKNELIWIHADLVVYDLLSNPKLIYKICSYTSYERNLKSIRNDLSDFEKCTHAKAFLAFEQRNGHLKVMSLEQVNDEIDNRKPPAKEEAINSFSEFYNMISRVCGNRGSDQQYFFRGQPDMKYPPLPSIYRKGRIENEKFLYREAVRRNSIEFTDNMSTFDNLVKMQHYELPTRLLDITKNPLVALFFACQKDPKADGEVLVYSMLQDQIKYYDSDAVCILANLAKRPIDFDFDKDKSYLVYDIQSDRPNFDGDMLGIDETKKVFCVLPRLNNNRIIKQDGAFFIFGMGEKKEDPAAILDEPITIIIKAPAKKKILKELELLGINDASLFPETDKVMHQIKEEFCGKEKTEDENQTNG
jgi:hypothetical protein